MAATDLLSVDEARRAVNVPSASSPDVELDLALFVAGISGRIDELCGPVVQRAVSNELHDGGRARILLNQHRAASISSVTEYVGTTAVTLTQETNASKPTSGYLVESTGPYTWLRRRAGNGDAYFASGRRNIEVSYVAGRFADTATVDQRFKLAGAGVLRRVFKREQSSWAQTSDFFADTENPRPTLMFFKAVDPVISELLHDQLLPPVGI